MACLTAAAALTVAAVIPAGYAQTMMVPLPSGRAPTEFYTNVPQTDPGDNPANWSARQNVADSHRYEWLVRTNAAFRAARIRKECGSITEADLFQQCVASFE
jgi:ABC-type transport system substrate-binding protein